MRDKAILLFTSLALSSACSESFETSAESEDSSGQADEVSTELDSSSVSPLCKPANQAPLAGRCRTSAAIYQQVCNGIVTRDLPSVKDLFADDFTFLSASSTLPWSGKEFKGFTGAVEFYSLIAQSVQATGIQVTGITCNPFDPGTLFVTFHESYVGRETGVSGTFDVIDIIKVNREGKLSSINVWMDTALAEILIGI